MKAYQLLFRVYLVVTCSYFVVKFGLRPLVAEHSSSTLLHFFVFSYPNFCEAVLGTITLTYLLLLLQVKFWDEQKAISAQVTYVVAVLLAAVYVLLQEFKIHNLGGTNIYDPMDILFSVIGLVFVYIVLRISNPTTLSVKELSFWR